MGKNLEYYLALDYELKIRKLTKDEGEGWMTEIPLLPGCIADGETIEEAVNNLQDAKAAWIETSMELGRAIPEPDSENYSGQLRLRMPKSLHKELSKKAKDENVSLNQLILYHLARGLGHEEKLI